MAIFNSKLFVYQRVKMVIFNVSMGHTHIYIYKWDISMG